MHVFSYIAVNLRNVGTSSILACFMYIAMGQEVHSLRMLVCYSGVLNMINIVKLSVYIMKF